MSPLDEARAALHEHDKPAMGPISDYVSARHLRAALAEVDRLVAILGADAADRAMRGGR